MLPNLLLKDLGSCLKNRGAISTVKLLWSSLIDWRETQKRSESFALLSSNRQLGKGNLYRPTRTKPFQTFLKTISLPKESNFLDFGAGEGRVLQIALDFGFRKVSGCEISPSLCNAAIAKLNKYPNDRWSIERKDAREFIIDPIFNIFYFYDPFEDEILQACLENISNSLKQFPRKTTLIYHNNLHSLSPNLIEIHKLKNTSIVEIMGNHFYLFEFE